MKRLCGHCLKRGHDRRNCPLFKRRRIVPGWSSPNASYAHNREIGACDNCGSPSLRRALCSRCRVQRARRPSRQPAYRKARRDGYGAKR